MNKLQQLINELCPDGVEYKKIKDTFTRLKGTPITAGKMKDISNPNGEITVVAGGKTIIKTNEEDIPNANIIKVPSVLVQSRGVIDIMYLESPFTFKNEMWAYTNEEKITVKYLYYVLKNNLDYFRNSASGMGSLPQISLPVTEDFKIPIPPLPVQEKIVRVLDNFTELTAELTAELAAELTARKQQYDYYRDELLIFGEDVPRVPLNDAIISLNTGLNPRQFFKLNTDDAKNYYITIREIRGGKIVPTDKTDRMNYEGLRLCNNRSNLEAGDVLFSGTGTIGETAVIEETPTNWNIKEGIYAIKPNPQKLRSHFLRYVLMSTFMRETYMKKVAGGTVKSIPMAEMKKLLIPLPTLENQDQLIALIERFDKLCNDIREGLPAEIKAREQQYEYYRNMLLTFKEKEVCENEYL